MSLSASEVRPAVRAFALSLADVDARPCWGEEGFFHHPPDSHRKLGRLFLTVREDPTRVPGEGRWRYSLPLPVDTYRLWFGPPPARPRRRMRHASPARHGPFAPQPVYAWNSWVQAADPAVDDLPSLAWAIREAYGRAVAKMD